MLSMKNRMAKLQRRLNLSEDECYKIRIKSNWKSIEKRACQIIYVCKFVLVRSFRLLEASTRADRLFLVLFGHIPGVCEKFKSWDQSKGTNLKISTKVCVDQQHQRVNFSLSIENQQLLASKMVEASRPEKVFPSFSNRQNCLLELQSKTLNLN